MPSYNALDRSIWAVHKISVLIAYAQKPPINTRADVSSVARDLNFGLSLLLPYFVRARDETSDKTARMHRLM